jgi:hypothetical protein
MFNIYSLHHNNKKTKKYKKITNESHYDENKKCIKIKFIEHKKELNKSRNYDRNMKYNVQDIKTYDSREILDSEAEVYLVQQLQILRDLLNEMKIKMTNSK